MMEFTPKKHGKKGKATAEVGGLCEGHEGIRGGQEMDRGDEAQSTRERTH